MTKMVILKLGGSVITDKRSGKPKLETQVVKRLAREIAIWHSSASGKGARLILLHGVGSYAHPLAHKYRLQGRKLNRSAVLVAGRIITSVRELGTCLSEAFLDVGLPVVPVQTSTLAQKKRGCVVFSDFSHIETILKHGGIPLLGGDVVIADGKKTDAASADELAVALAKRFRARRILFATDIDGVYAHFPPRRGEQPLPCITREELRSIRGRASRNARDVTGGMIGKLRELASLRKCEVLVFSALKRGALAGALCGESHGTTIVL